MKKKHNKTKQQVVSNVSDDNTLDGTTTPQGPAARGRTHPGGIFTGTFSTQGSISPPVIQPLVNWPPVNWSPVNWPPVIYSQNKKSLPVTGQPVIAQINTSQPITGHRSSCHQSLEIDYQAPDISQLSLVDRSPVISQIIRLQFVVLMLLALNTQQITNQIWVLNTHLGMNL